MLVAAQVHNCRNATTVTNMTDLPNAKNKQFVTTISCCCYCCIRIKVFGKVCIALMGDQAIKSAHPLQQQQHHHQQHQHPSPTKHTQLKVPAAPTRYVSGSSPQQNHLRPPLHSTNSAHLGSLLCCCCCCCWRWLRGLRELRGW